MYINLITFFLIICLLGVFSLTPLAAVSDAYQLTFAYYGILIFFFYRMYRSFLLRTIMMTWSALVMSSFVSSMINLNQDMFSSFIAVQGLMKGFAVFVIIPWAIDNRIDWDRIVKWMMRMSWISATIIAVLSAMRYDISFTSAISGVNYQITPERINKSLIFFAVIYYLVKYVKARYYGSLVMASVLFTTTQIYDIVRGDWLFMGVLVAILFYRYMPPKNLLSTVSTLILVGCVAFYSMDSSGFKEKFGQMFMLVDSEERGKIVDASVFVRIKEAAYANEGFLKHPLFGNGLIRASRKVELIGEVYFYPSDVGVIGILYSFGIFGILVFLVVSLLIMGLLRSRVVWPGEAFLYFGLYEVLGSLKDGGMLLHSPGPVSIALVFASLHVTTNLEVNGKSNDIRRQEAILVL